MTSRRDLQCESGTKLGEQLAPGVVEIACRNRHCGAGSGVLVLHSFDLSGETPVRVGTKKFHAVPETREG